MTDRNTGVSRREFIGRSAALAGVLAASATDVTPAAASSTDGVTASNQIGSHLTLWYRRPAQQWVEALPIGNGRLGAMVFGGIERERLQLNEDTLWSGGPRGWNNPNAPNALAEVRRLIAEEKYVEADRAARGMQGPYTQSFLPLGDLVLEFEHGDIAPGGYRRQLDLHRGARRPRHAARSADGARGSALSHRKGELRP